MFDYLVDKVLEISMFIISKVKLIKNFEQRWVDIGATIHVYTIKKCFTCKEVDGENLYMKYSSTSKILSVGKVILKMTSIKLFTFNNRGV
jgi:hypothetical protein